MQELSSIYSHPGPFATVYLDATRASESGAHEVELRWRALRTSLREQNADERDLDALEAAALNEHEVGASGLVLVGADGQVLLHERLSRPPLRDMASAAPLPHLMPYLAQRGSRTAYLVVVVDREGADIGAAPWLDEPSATVEGSEHPVHKTGRNTWDELHFQHRVENTWAANAREVADAVIASAAKHSIELVVVTGDTRARALLAEQLQSGLRQDVAVVAVDGPSRAESLDFGKLTEVARDAVLRHDWRRRRELLEHLQQNLGRDEYAVAGVAPVVDALRRAAVDTLIVSDDPSSTLHAFIGPDAVQFGLHEDELRDMGVPAPTSDRLDSALVRAVVGTGARLVVTPNAHDYVAEGVGALLRYDDRASS